MPTHGSKSRKKTSLQNCQKLGNRLGNIEIFPDWNPIFLPKIQFSSTTFQPLSTAFCFPQRLSTFLNSFPIFLNSFPLSKKSKKIYLRRQVSKRLLFQLYISHHLLPELCNSRYNVYISPNKHIILFEFSADDKLWDFSLVMYEIVCLVRWCSQNHNIFCAVNETYCFSLVLPGNLLDNILCCYPIHTIFGAVKYTSYFSLVLLMNYILWFGAVILSSF